MTLSKKQAKEKEFKPESYKEVIDVEFTPEQIPWINAPQVNQGISIET